MVRVKHQENNNNDIVKSQLANDTYYIYKNSRNNSSCIHINNIHSSSSSFIDWYLILKVGEDASIATIRKQYHKLALLLHPDKNKHPKAEFSFKLISQAFECLSDNAKRSSFHLERWKNKCTKCNRATHIDKPAETSSPSSRKNSRTRETPHDYRALREQLKEDARVIENCMKLNRASKDDYPVFNPSNYSNIGYPHRRNHPNSWNLQKENVVFNYDQRRSRCENPVFELRTGCRNMNVNSASVTS